MQLRDISIPQAIRPDSVKCYHTYVYIYTYLSCTLLHVNIWCILLAPLYLLLYFISLVYVLLFVYCCTLHCWMLITKSDLVAVVHVTIKKSLNHKWFAFLYFSWTNSHLKFCIYKTLLSSLLSPNDCVRSSCSWTHSAFSFFALLASHILTFCPFPPSLRSPSSSLVWITVMQ